VTTSCRQGQRRKSFPPKLDLVLQLLRAGDTLKVTRLDRLSGAFGPAPGDAGR
jgi:DNA invertase Pin-like site-specific DNA recombinase